MKLHRRNRLLYLALIALVIICGLLVRSDSLALPTLLANHVGDALWALLIFLGFGFLLPARSTTVTATLAVVVCVSVECSQLYHAPWLDDIRHTLFGRLVLGDTFGWGDLVAYLVGIVAGSMVEWSVSRRRPYQSEATVNIET